MGPLFASGFIEDEISKEDFVKAIYTYNARFAAPLKCIILPDENGCQPVIYDNNEMYKTRNFFIDTIVRNIDKYSEDNNLRIAALAKQDICAREPTLSEARLSFRKKAEILDKEELETYRYKKGSIQEGMLLRDTDDKIYDFPSNYRWVKSIFMTAVSVIKGNENEIEVMDNLLNTIDAISEKIYSNKANIDYKLIHVQYTHVEVGPMRGYHRPISDSDKRCGYMSNFTLEDIHNFFNKTKIPTICATDRYFENIFYEELRGYDDMNVEPHKQFIHGPLKINKKLN